MRLFRCILVALGRTASLWCLASNLDPFMTGTSFDLVDSASDFGTIVESEQEIIFGELIDDEPVTPTILTDSTNR
jgi:hypothetical protein